MMWTSWNSRGSRWGLALAGVMLLAPAVSAQRVHPERVDQVKPQAVPQDQLVQKKPKGPADAAVAGVLEAQQRLKKDTPIGRGVIVGHVEGNQGSYTPPIQDPRFRNISFVTRSGPSPKPSGHANTVARKLYGQGGLAPGIREVHSFTTTDWLGPGFLNTGTGHPPRLDDKPRLYTHSWISPLDGRPGAEVLRRVDYAIDQAGVLMCVGVNNGRDKPVPPLLGSAYNVIAVGAINGNSSGGYTAFEGEGRAKPDIVAPGGLTSFATPVVAAVVARLLEAADGMAPAPDAPAFEDAAIQPVDSSGGSEADDADTPSSPPAPPNPAARPEVIKAVLLAGTNKPERWQPEPGKPLDEHLGAGVVHFDQSLKILQAGQPEGEDIRRCEGWKFGSIPAQGIVSLHLDLRDVAGPASFALVWHRRIDGRTVLGLPKGSTTPVKGWVQTPRLADLDLRLVRINPDGSETTLEQSASRVDNVEYLHLPVMMPGEYRIDIIRQPDDAPDPAWDYALAWRIGDEVDPGALEPGPEASPASPMPPPASAPKEQP